jgi:hypothetical protein
MYVAHLRESEMLAELIRKSRKGRPSGRIGHSGKYNIKMHSKESGQDSKVCIVPTVGWMVQGSNHNAGEIFHTHSDYSWGPPSPLYNEYQVSFPE